MAEDAREQHTGADAEGPSAQGPSSREADPQRPDVARMYDYYLGGTENYEVDRKAAEQVIAIEPMARDAAWANRGFLQRAASWIASQGVDQFLDLGAGLPTRNNTHDVVRAVNPDARIVYVDSNPEAVRHGSQLVGDVSGVSYVQGDMREPERLLADPGIADELDFTRPIGLLLIGVLYFVADPVTPSHALINRLGAGSYVAISHLTRDHQDESLVSAGEDVYSSANENIFARTRADIEGMVQGSALRTEFVPPYAGADPGLCYVGQWNAEDPQDADDDAGRWVYAGVVRTT